MPRWTLEESRHEPAAATNRIEVSQFQPGDEEEWDRLVTSSPSGTLFHLSKWRHVVEKVLGHRTVSLIARRDRRISGVFPVSWLRSRLFGDCLVSSPLAVYGGICAEDEESHTALLRAGTELGRRLGVKYLEMRNRDEPFAMTLPRKDLYVTFIQDLTPGPEKLLQGLPRDTRYAVRKSIKAGLEWTEDLTVAEFYEIYAESVHRLGTPVFSRRLFETLRTEFPAQSRIFGVRKGKQAIAGVFCLYFRDQVLPYYGGALFEFLKDSPNNFMYWNLMAQSCKEGYRVFDFGRSKKGTGSYHFKMAWNMQVRELPYRYQLIRAKEIPRITPVDKKFQLPVELWKRLPYALTKMIGPSVVRRIPSI
jgi:FemAB-related protein (PEP-CTERM system-associated)